MPRLLSVLLLIPALAACRGSEGVLPPGTANAHFRVIADTGGADAEAAGLAAVSPVWSVVAEVWGAAPTAPDAPLDIHLYVRADGFRQADAQLTGGERAAHRAFAHPATTSAHVDLQPRIDPGLIPTHGLPAQTERLLAHEAAHLARFALVPGHRHHPRWVANGSAVDVAARTMAARNADRAADEAPFTATLVGLAQRLAKHGRLPPLTSLLADELPAPDGKRASLLERYALEWLAWRFLREQRDRLGEFFRDLRHAKPAGDPGALRDDIVAQLGTDADALDAQWAEFVAALSPAWFEEGRGLSLGAEEWEHCAFEETHASAWRLESRAPPYSVTGSVEILTGDTVASVQLSAAGGDRMHVRLWPLAGGERTRVYVVDGTTNKEVAHVLVDTRSQHAFRIDVTLDQIHVTVDGDAHVATATIARLDGPWGLGLSAGGVCLWRDVTVE